MQFSSKQCHILSMSFVRSWKNINQMGSNFNGHDQKGKKSKQDSLSEFEMLELGLDILKILGQHHFQIE